jgi:hypothetical protein
VAWQIAPGLLLITFAHTTYICKADGRLCSAPQLLLRSRLAHRRSYREAMAGMHRHREPELPRRSPR